MAVWKNNQKMKSCFIEQKLNLLKSLNRQTNSQKWTPNGGKLVEFPLISHKYWKIGSESAQTGKYAFLWKLASILEAIAKGGDETRSGYVQYVQGNQPNVPCTFIEIYNLNRPLNRPEQT